MSSSIVYSIIEENEAVLRTVRTIALYTSLGMVGVPLVLYLTVFPCLAALVGSFQERKIWKPQSLPSLSLWGQSKVFLFNLLWMYESLVGCFFVSLRALFLKKVLGKRVDTAEECFNTVEVNVSKSLVWCLIGDCVVTGQENLPPLDVIPAPVYIGNHASQIDTAAAYFLGRRFKWVAKKSVLYVPGAGWVMYLGQHVLINRIKGKNKTSVNTLFDKSNQAIQRGIPMLFFPQGTRWMAESLPLKDGAFIVAETNKSLLVPFSIEIPMDAWNSWYPLSLLWTQKRPIVKLTIHQPIQVSTGPEFRERLKQDCFDQIYSVLPVVPTATKVGGESSKESKDNNSENDKKEK